MKLYQLLAGLAMLLGICSCGLDDGIEPLSSSDLIGHWNISVPSGLQFVEFIDNDKVLIDDRGAIGTTGISKRYYDSYSLDLSERVIQLAATCRMEEVSVDRDRMTFVFVCKSTGYRMPYTAHKILAENEKINRTEVLSQTWITTEENGKTLAAEDQKIAYFSPAGIYFLKNVALDDIQLYSWSWSDGVESEQLCYTPYQRPTFIPIETCINFIELTDSHALMDINGSIIKMEQRSTI